MNIVIDCSSFSGTELDMSIIAYAATNYAFVPEPFNVADSEEIQYEADEALIWMDSIARNGGYTYFIEDNCLYMDSYAELGV